MKRLCRPAIFDIQTRAARMGASAMTMKSADTSGFFYLAAMTSISRAAPRGRASTCTVVRAGKFSEKYD
jgi:hypothetical protein